jgi:hypothetical protein
MGIAGTQMVLYRRFLARLRKGHADVWRELGSPATGFSLSTWKTGRETDRFLRHQRYRQLHDPQLTHYAQQYRRLQVPRTLVLVLFLLASLTAL